MQRQAALCDMTAHPAAFTQPPPLLPEVPSYLLEDSAAAAVGTSIPLAAEASDRELASPLEFNPEALVRRGLPVQAAVHMLERYNEGMLQSISSYLQQRVYPIRPAKA